MLQFSTQQMEINSAEVGEVLERGRMYERYREKREAKLREEWFLRMEGKEAEMRAMWDSFELARTPSSSQKISRLSDVPSDLHTRQKVTKPVHDEKKTKVNVSRNSSMKRSSLDRSTFSMPLTKENRAPTSKDSLNISSSVSSSRGLSRSRTITEEKKKGAPVKSHHRRNTLAGPAEFRGFELDKNFYSDITSPRKSNTSKSFLKKGSGIGPGAGAAVAKQRSAISRERRDTESNFGSGDLSLSWDSLTDFSVPGSGAAMAEQRSSISRERRDTKRTSGSGDLSLSWDSLTEFSLPVGTSFTYSESQTTELNEIRGTEAFIRERKKWGMPEKPVLFSSESQKDGTKSFKKLLLNIVGKKNRESSVPLCIA